MKKEWSCYIKPGEAMHRLKANGIFCALLMLVSSLSFALQRDREQVMNVVADSADLNQMEHKGTYIGNVEFAQGTTNLHAAKAITQGNEKNKLVFAIAYGHKEKQAHYWTESEPNKPSFHAYADTIRYYPLRHLIELVGNAHVEQGNNSMSAAKITYDTLKQHVISSSNGATRTTIILHPEKKPT